MINTFSTNILHLNINMEKFNWFETGRKLCYSFLNGYKLVVCQTKVELQTNLELCMLIQRLSYIVPKLYFTQ